jgi:hypothetical protein
VALYKYSFHAASAQLEWTEVDGASVFIDGQILAYCGVQSMQERRGLSSTAQIYLRDD